jgi:hypothetical protein
MSARLIGKPTWLVVGPILDKDAKPITDATLASTCFRLSKNGAADVALADETGAILLKEGQYRISLNASDTDTLGELALILNYPDYVMGPVTVPVTQTAVVPSMKRTTIPVQGPGGIPLAGVEVCIATDQEGTNVILAGYTDALGNVVFDLAPGTYYVFCQLAGYEFANPWTLTVE